MSVVLDCEKPNWEMMRGLKLVTPALVMDWAMTKRLTAL